MQRQNHLQKQSHEWCQGWVTRWMKDGEEEIVIHNTFTREIFIKPYFELAKQYGYSVHIVHSEGVILPSGERTISTHSVPQDILDSMRSSFEPFNKIPKVGITPADIAVQMSGLHYPQAIIFDMDKTIKRPKNGRTFPQSPNDFELMPEFINWLDGYDYHNLDLYIVSNQRGITKGQKTEEFLKTEVELLQETLQLRFNKMYFPTSKNTCLVYDDGDWMNWKSENQLEKPSTGVFVDIQLDSLLIDFWIVGDAHSNETATDWQYAQNCQRQFPELDIRYVPIEMLNLYWSLVS
jgi:histidinol phosphatase-like enzyme